jgi:hypothetical protein
MVQMFCLVVLMVFLCNARYTYNYSNMNVVYERFSSAVASTAFVGGSSDESAKIEVTRNHFNTNYVYRRLRQ